MINITNASCAQLALPSGVQVENVGGGAATLRSGGLWQARVTLVPAPAPQLQQAQAAGQPGQPDGQAGQADGQPVQGGAQAAGQQEQPAEAAAQQQAEPAGPSATDEPAESSTAGGRTCQTVSSYCKSELKLSRPASHGLRRS